MKLTFVGTSHGIPEVGRFCTSMFLEVNGSLYIIDGGAPVSPMLLRYGYTHETVKGVFVTHLHGDHFDGLFEFCDQLGWLYLNSNPKFLFPEEKGVELMRFYMKSMSATKRELDLNSYTEGKIFEDENITVTAIPTDHSNLPSYAFEVIAEGKHFLFSGDVHHEFTERDRLFTGKKYDLVILEAAHPELKEFKELISGINTKQILLNHYYCKRNLPEDMEKLGEELPFKFSVAYDGLTVDL